MGTQRARCVPTYVHPLRWLGAIRHYRCGPQRIVRAAGRVIGPETKKQSAASHA